MKTPFLLSAALLAAATATAQITIDQNDMPVAGSALIVSNGGQLATINLQQTGPNQTWNFSGLRPISQDTILFAPVTATPAFYQLVFNNPFSPNHANLASPEEVPFAPPGLQLSDVYSFYKKTATQYKQTGYGATLNGSALPIGFSNPDVVYKLPLTFGNAPDSSVSGFVLNVPNLMYVAEDKKRVNQIDGWGTLTTPFGTFQTVRVVSKITSSDTVSYDTMQVRLNRPLTREYKWLGKNQGIPLLQITTQELLPGLETISGIRYRDIYRNLSLSRPAALPEATLSAYPNPFERQLTLRWEQPLPEPAALLLTDALGREVLRHTVPAGTRTLHLQPDQALTAGLYLLRLRDSRHTRMLKLVCSPR